MVASHYTTADKRTLIKVVFDRQSPYADAPTLEVIFQVHFPESFDLTSDVKVLLVLSVTRQDTREAVQLTEDELKMAMHEAGEHAAGMAESWSADSP